MEPQLENVVMKLAPETALVRILPFSVDYLECNVFVGSTGREPQDGKVSVVVTRCDFVLGCLASVYQV